MYESDIMFSKVLLYAQGSLLFGRKTDHVREAAEEARARLGARKDNVALWARCLMLDHKYIKRGDEPRPRPLWSLQ